MQLATFYNIIFQNFNSSPQSYVFEILIDKKYTILNFEIANTGDELFFGLHKKVNYQIETR